MKFPGEGNAPLWVFQPCRVHSRFQCSTGILLQLTKFRSKETGCTWMHLKVKEFQIQTRRPGESHQQLYNVDLIKKLNSITSKIQLQLILLFFIIRYFYIVTVVFWKYLFCLWMFTIPFKREHWPHCDYIFNLYFKMKGCLLFPNASGIFIFKGEHSPQYDYICSHCVSKNSLSIWILIPRFLSVTLLLHDQENMWNKTSYYSCILLSISYYVYTLSFPCYH